MDHHHIPAPRGTIARVQMDEDPDSVMDLTVVGFEDGEAIVIDDEYSLGDVVTLVSWLDGWLPIKPTYTIQADDAPAAVAPPGTHAQVQYTDPSGHEGEDEFNVTGVERWSDDQRTIAYHPSGDTFTARRFQEGVVVVVDDYTPWLPYRQTSKELVQVLAYTRLGEPLVPDPMSGDLTTLRRFLRATSATYVRTLTP